MSSQFDDLTYSLCGKPKPNPCTTHPEELTCTATAYQFTNISVPVEIKPKAIVEKIELDCDCQPEVVCTSSTPGTC